jgi:hypothetical protein
MTDLHHSRNGSSPSSSTNHDTSNRQVGSGRWGKSSQTLSGLYCLIRFPCSFVLLHFLLDSVCGKGVLSFSSGYPNLCYLMVFYSMGFSVLFYLFFHLMERDVCVKCMLWAENLWSLGVEFEMPFPFN